ncbi:DM13 domain-containing protein [Flavobacterium psychrophilum]|uniref:DM13 domain-containing protein n=1 Tax=Flavobacterium psychrophilum TaxID=96345 RepID=UPI0009041AF0|nr:DM13 domain-containing protein [Flavobacterium psychrophilum]EKT3958522.1 DM13 domain-containing protein [Flavobacterium psychrophilum]EKT3963519.1 DM13 domain-containing protein [Flavobacterium psychrophilum]EKT4497616.1 DM13 domain-containing protein [Flavobacterium psychrophilum]EKT4501014.1 DM13 domain-containing protein [Flavobacterium psychrophilum]EKT4510822.1 DM13 domain-containing protein [Flavobacterium psychrophilum]
MIQKTIQMNDDKKRLCNVFRNVKMMRNVFVLLLGIFLFTSCEKEGKLILKSLKNDIIGSGAVLKYSGVFSPTSGITTSGFAKIYLDNNEYKVKLENFSVSDGPDLKVYLSKENTPINFVNLGNLKGNKNKFYTVPTGTNVSEYKYVLIHCQEYNHLFAIAQFTSI